MALIDLSDLPQGPILALDPGSKTIGVASCGATRGLATPVETIQRTKFTADAARIFQLYDERKAVGLVIGLPYNMRWRAICSACAISRSSSRTNASQPSRPPRR